MVDFDLRLLPAFVTVAEERHFGRAAEKLHIAQPALSQQIRRLEAQIGMRLFERDARRVELTAAGSALLVEAQAALHAAERGALAARSLARTQRAALYLAVDVDVPRRTLGKVRTFAAGHPELDVRVTRQHQGHALRALHAGEVDVVLGWTRMPYGPPVRTAAIDSAELVVALREDHPEAGCRSMTRQTFGRYPFAMFERASSTDIYDWIVIAATGRQPDQVDAREVHSLYDGCEAMLRGALIGCGMTVAIRDTFEAMRLSGLRAVPFAPPLSHDILAIWTPQGETPWVRALAEECAGAPREPCPDDAPDAWSTADAVLDGGGARGEGFADT
jgi:DNA-binding transcriptional LysR family regulator